MKTKTKRIWLALTLVTLAVAAGLLWKKQPPPQIITLPNGEKVQFVSVTYGTKHIQPELAARLVSKVPSSLTNLVQRALGNRLGPITSFRTPKVSLCVWFKTVQDNGTHLIMAFSTGLADDQGSFFAEARWSNIDMPQRERDNS